MTLLNVFGTMLDSVGSVKIVFIFSQRFLRRGAYEI